MRGTLTTGRRNRDRAADASPAPSRRAPGRRAAGALGRQSPGRRDGADPEFFRRTPHLEAWLSVCQAGTDSARRLGDDAALSFLLLSLGQAYGETRCFADADRCFTEALEIRRRTGDRQGEAMALNCLAVSLARQDQPEPALEYLGSALDIAAAVGDRHGTATVLNNMGDVLLSLGRHDEAMDSLKRALGIRQEIGDGFRTSTTQTTLGEICRGLGRYEEAVEHCELALASSHGIVRGNLNRADALSTLGDALAHLGRADQAREAWLTALPILDQLNDPRATALRDRLEGQA